MLIVRDCDCRCLCLLKNVQYKLVVLLFVLFTQSRALEWIIANCVRWTTWKPIVYLSFSNVPVLENTSHLAQQKPYCMIKCHLFYWPKWKNCLPPEIYFSRLQLNRKIETITFDKNINSFVQVLLRASYEMSLLKRKIKFYSAIWILPTYWKCKLLVVNIDKQKNLKRCDSIIFVY